MKISDEELEEIKEESGLGFLAGDRQVAIVEELQQLREEKRWRKVSSEVPEKSCNCLFYQKGNRFTGGCKVDEDKSGVTWVYRDGNMIGTLAKLYWRPLPMDLP